MKIVCLEEHVATPGIVAAWQGLNPATRDLAIELSVAASAMMIARSCNKGQWLMMGSGVMAVDAVLPLRSWPEPVFRGLEPAFFGWFSGRIAPLNVVVLNVVVPCRPLT